MLNNFLHELRRRHVIRAAIAYVVAAWLAMQIADVLLPVFDAPDWIMQIVLAALLLDEARKAVAILGDGIEVALVEAQPGACNLESHQLERRGRGDTAQREAEAVLLGFHGAHLLVETT